MQTKPISELRLKKAKQQLKGQMALSMDVNSTLMHSFGKSLLTFGQIDTIHEIHKSIDAITAAQLCVLAKQYMSKDKLSVLVFDLK